LALTPLPPAVVTVQVQLAVVETGLVWLVGWQLMPLPAAWLATQVSVDWSFGV
jgi:hypothetical protein